MEVKIEGNKLHLTLELDKDPATSKSGKSKIAAGTSGFVKTSTLYKGKPLSVSVNAIIPL